MPLRREDCPKRIADQLHLLANMLKTRSRASLTDANHSLETVMLRFFNALYGWNLLDLNEEQQNFPSADLGDRKVRVAMQITNENAGSKIAETAATATAHDLAKDFDRLIIFFLLERKPRHPKGFRQLGSGPKIECMDITDLLKKMKTMDDLGALARAEAVLKEELSAGIEATPLARYLQTLYENFCTYENVGLPPPANAEGEKDVPIPIGRLFVVPTCTSQLVSPKEFDEALRGGGKNAAQPLLPLLAHREQRRTILLADPGMGKSTLVQWLIATLAASEELPPEASALRGAIPLPFILRDLVHLMPRDHAEWDWRTLLEAFRRYHPRAADRPALAAAICADEAQFRTILNSKRAFFLIDGLDEIGDPNRRRALRNALWAGFDRFPFARWLVTSRIVGYEEAIVHSKTLTSPQKEHLVPLQRPVHDSNEIFQITVAQMLAQVFYLAPFDDVQQLAFAENWYVPRLGNVGGKERAGSFVKAVRQHPSVRAIGRVPNLLYLLALLYRHKAHLPNGRALVYAEISEAYLEGIDLDRHLKGHQTAPYKLQDKIRFLATIARHMQERRAVETDAEEAGEILVSRTELENWLEPLFPGDDGCVALHSFIGYVAARSGLLLPRGEGLFGFAHLSFQEYYAACWLEDEFRRLLNSQAAAASTGFLRRHSAESSGALTRKDFAVFASQDCWRESTIFLVEKVSANADDTLTLVDWLFPQLGEASLQAGAENSAELMPIAAARLLATLSLDPQVSLDLEQRQSIWSVLWQAHIAQQKTNRWHLTSTLLSNPEFEKEVFSSLIQCDLKELNLDYCIELVDLQPIVRLTQLRSLSLANCFNLVDLQPLASLTLLQRLSLENCYSLVNLGPLAGLTQLQSIDLFFCGGVVDLQPLSNLMLLTSLRLKNCFGVADLEPLAGLTQLQFLDLADCDGVVDLKPLIALTQLQSLRLAHYENLVDLKLLAGLTQLRRLDLASCDRLVDLKPLAGLTQLQSLNLANCESVVDLHPLTGLTQLQSLDLSFCREVVDLQPLAGLTRLRTLRLMGCEGVVDLQPLVGLKQLRSLNLKPYKGLSQRAVAAFSASRPDVEINQFAM